MSPYMTPELIKDPQLVQWNEFTLNLAGESYAPLFLAMVLTQAIITQAYLLTLIRGENCNHEKDR